jgi:selenide,water dikinase
VAKWEARLVRVGPAVRDVVVVGGGAAGVELALALQFRLGASARVRLISGGGPVLTAYPRAVGRRARRALRRNAVAVFEQPCLEVTPDSLLLGNGMRLPCDAAVLAIGGVAPRWLAGSGLARDESGFVATGPTLQSLSHTEVFAAGDVAGRIDAPRPHSGVFAVRAGPPLAQNLRRFADGEATRRYVPQRRSLNLLACGEQRAIVSWGGLAAEGHWAWRWKDHIDRRFVNALKVSA